MIDAQSIHDLMRAFVRYCQDNNIPATFDELKRFRTIHQQS